MKLNDKKLLISLFDYTGNASLPFKEMGWNVLQIDIQLGIDILKWNYKKVISDYISKGFTSIGIIAMIPCDNYAVCGAKHFKEKRIDGRLKESQKLVACVKEIIYYVQDKRVLKFWMVENPKTTIHKLNRWLGDIVQKFHPWHFAQYDPVPNNSRYFKETWLFGHFKKCITSPMRPFEKDSPMWKSMGGRSLTTKNARSKTPLGFAYAFAKSNG